MNKIGFGIMPRTVAKSKHIKPTVETYSPKEKENRLVTICTDDSCTTHIVGNTAKDVADFWYGVRLLDALAKEDNA